MFIHLFFFCAIMKIVEKSEDMKKLYFLGLFFLCFIIPINIHAIKIDKVSIQGNKEMKPKEDITLDFNIDFKDIESGLDKTLGIWYINFELLYDRDLLEIKDVSSKDFDISVLEEKATNKIYIFGEVIDNKDDSKYCADGMLYCSSNYTVSVKFHLKDTKKDITSIRMSSIETGLLDMVEAKEYTEKDAMVIITPDIAVHDITIKQEKPKNSNTNKNTNTNTTTESRYLKSLEIEESGIEFKKDVTDYVIYVEKDVNKLNIKAEAEDSKATIEIIGADDLKKSNHQVKVVVTAKDKTKKTYYIKVKEKKVETEPVEKPLKKKKKELDKIDSDSLLKWASIGAGILVAIAIIFFIISKIKDYSIDKKLKKLDDD